MKKVEKETDFHVFNVDFAEGGDQTISVSLKDKRCFAAERNYKYSNARILVARILGNGQLEYVHNKFHRWERDHYVELKEAKKGTYQVFVELDWDESVS